ncbi:MAG: ribosome maturation factor RimP [Lachnospiraceae bacterium]|nr:ribosome maturation factor RimP [Lachnospiraceae bacterium]
MSKRESYEQKTEMLLVPILEEFGFDLWDVEYVKEGSEYYLRAYIDKEGGITIDDCVDVSRKLSDKLDEDDFIEGEYILEVSSPGLGRALKRDRDYEKSIGREIDLKLYKAIDKVKEFTGILKLYDKDKIVVTIDDEDKEFLKSDLASVKLHVEF